MNPFPTGRLILLSCLHPSLCQCLCYECCMMFIYTDVLYKPCKISCCLSSASVVYTLRGMEHLIQVIGSMRLVSFVSFPGYFQHLLEMEQLLPRVKSVTGLDVWLGQELRSYSLLSWPSYCLRVLFIIKSTTHFNDPFLKMVFLVMCSIVPPVLTEMLMSLNEKTL